MGAALDDEERSMITAIEAVMLALSCLILGGMIGVIAMALAVAARDGKE